MMQVQQKANIDDHSSAVYTICYSSDGNKFVSGSAYNFTCIWDFKTGQQKAKLDGHSSTHNSVNFSPDGNTLAYGSHDNSIRLRNVQTSKRKYFNQIVAKKICLPSLICHFRIAPFCQMLILILQYLEYVKILSQKYQGHLSFKDNQ
ncbi:unnamed protein product [Paramecium octaurelia]|uniref:Uncharacterized protein n=1 Tax=Paramecium octaurelia TaxID=43137 RepID=A0A8S1YK32_PAROT|nr:unnamed protein product [Paramecium octaurelia]